MYEVVFLGGMEVIFIDELDSFYGVTASESRRCNLRMTQTGVHYDGAFEQDAEAVCDMPKVVQMMQTRLAPS